LYDIPPLKDDMASDQDRPTRRLLGGGVGLRHALVACTVLAGSAGIVYAQSGTTQGAAAPAPVPAAPAQPASANPAVAVLLERANFWRNQTQYDQALESLNRVLALEPANSDALALIGQIQADRGNRPAAEQALAKLRQAAPGDPRIDKIDQALKIGPIPQEALADARRLAKDGRVPEAVDRYNRVLRGNPPPDSLAVEYYQTLAGTDDAGWTQARDGLARSVRNNPQDLRAQLAYAQVLTYRDNTRDEGIKRLQQLARNPAVAENANQAWRQAVGWLPQNKSSIDDISAYLAVHPNDAEIAQRLEDARNPKGDPNDPSAIKRASGFDLLNAGKLNDAATAFQAAIDINPRDADANGGLGVIRLRQKRYDEARTLLNRAIELDPNSRGKWGPALNGIAAAEKAAAPNPAVALLANGNNAAAEAELRRQIGAGSTDPGLLAMLATALTKQNKLADAEQTYRTLVSRTPRNTAAIQGLAGVLSQEGKTAEADNLLQQAGLASRDPALINQARAQQLRDQAATVSDPVTQAGLYRSALAADPNNPWIRLDYARALMKQGGLREARAIMADGLGRNPTPDALRAGVLFANESHDPDAAAALLARIPPASRSADLRDLAVQVDLQRQIERVIDLPRMTARARLLALAAAPDPTGVRGATIARALNSIGDASSARRAIIIARDSTPTQGSAARIAYAGAFLDIGDVTAAQTMIAPLGYGGSLPPDQKAAYAALRQGLAIRSADADNQAGKQAAGYDRLAPALASDPDNADMNLALARLYQGAKNPREALEINEALLRRDPANSDARRGAVAAALQLGNRTRAAELVKEGLDVAPDDPKAWLASADYARASGNNARALRDLARARELRLQQLGYSDNGNDDSTLANVTLSPGDAPIQTRTLPRVKLAPLGSGQAPSSALPLYPSADRGQDVPDALAVPPGLSQAARPTPLAPPANPSGSAPPAYQPPTGRVLDTTQADTLPRPQSTQPRRLAQSGLPPANSSADALNAEQLNGSPSPAAAAYPPAYTPAAPIPQPGTTYSAAPGYSPPAYRPATTQPSPGGQYIPPQYAQPQYAQTAPGYSQTYVPSYAQPQYVQPAAVPAGSAPSYPGYLPPVAPSGQPYQSQVPPEQRYQPQVQEYLPQYRPAPPPSPSQQLLQDDAQFLRGGDFEKPYRPYLPRINGDETVPFGASTNDGGPTNFYDNPFRRSPDAALQASAGVPAGNGLSGPDPVTQEIDQKIVGIRDELAPSVQGGVNFRLRSGDAGLDKLTEINAPLEATFAPGGVGTVKLTVTPTSINSGSIGGDDSNLQRFGTYALGLVPPVQGPPYQPAYLMKNITRPGSQQAQGTGIDAELKVNKFTADVGSTPVGFRKQNVVGGVEFAPQISENITLRLGAERRAMTDSVLSYAGTVDPRTGQTWGGVVRDRLRAAVEFNAGGADFYVDGSAAQITGQHVQRNNGIEAGTGVSYPLVKTDDQEIRIGGDLFYESYTHNLRFFTLGQGGYFSPQSYVSALVPLSYTGKQDDLTYTLGGAIGLQSFSEKASNYYPIDAALQTQLTSGTQFNGLNTFYPSRSSSGIAGKLNAKVDYLVTPNLHLGGTFAYQHSGDFDEAIGGVYARYVFNGAARK
jgi:tetratricopeptide (TPR) repeat protein